jgi:hypothetical protein
MDIPGYICRDREELRDQDRVWSAVGMFCYESRLSDVLSNRVDLMKGTSLFVDLFAVCDMFSVV